MTSAPDLGQRLTGLLLGTAVGDALGLPAEGLSRQRLERFWAGRWRHRLILGHGMCSDDTEHGFLTAQALLACPGDATGFSHALAWGLRFWLLGVPAGIGMATLRSVLRLWLGFPPSRSGVRSAGNGAAMRTAILGAYFFDDAGVRRAFVAASTRLTHTDPRAGTAALAVAEAAAWVVRQDTPLNAWVRSLPELGDDEEWRMICAKFANSFAGGKSVAEFARELGQDDGVSGYSYHSVPVALYAWSRSPLNFETALVAALNCGGDTDTVGAIVGALAGAGTGPEGIPAAWLEGVCEWPRSQRVLESAARALALQKSRGRAAGPVRYFWPGLVVRNLLFAGIVLAHGFRRLAPPY